jgi:hypothetical protein
VDNVREGSLDILPDSRLRDRLKGVVRGLFRGVGFINWIPVYCANCGKPHGYVPEENCDFTCWLCTPCSEKWGEQYGLALVPDEVFWQKARAEQLEKYGRLLTPNELQTVAESGCSPLAKLLRDKR